MISTTILLFNGLHFPIDAIDTAIAWTQKTNGQLTALFVVADKDQDEGYPFPNDLEVAEDGPAEAETTGADFAIIADTIRLMRRQAAFARIALQTRIVAKPKEHTLREYFESAENIFLTENTIDAAVLSINSEKITAALSGLPAKVEWIN